MVREASTSDGGTLHVGGGGGHAFLCDEVSGGLEAACAVGCFLGSFYYCCDLAIFDVTTVELFWGIGAKGGMKTFAKNIFLVLWEQMTPTSLWSYNIYIFSHLFIKAV